MDLQTLIGIGLGILIAVDIALLERSNRKLQRQLLDLAKKSLLTGYEIKLTCDNSQAMASLAEVQAAAERAAGVIDKARGIVH